MGIKETLFHENRKTTLIALVLIGAAVLSMGTWALFTDSEPAEDNTVEAGTLDLTVDEGNTGTISITNAQPGDTDNETFNLRNVGSTEADHVTFDFNTTETDSEPEEPTDPDLNTELNASETAAMIEVTELGYNGTDELSTIADENDNGITDLEDLENTFTGSVEFPAPPANGADTTSLTLGLQVANDDDGSFTGTDEDIMADGVHLTIHFTLNQ